ncbi:hypothetical protein NW062_02210 [Mycoplasmopsis cynos]|nr:hypothetical protein NW062_02210 [Mycoplasmopsis cynos]
MNLPTDEKIYKINLDYESAKEMIHYLELRTFEIELLSILKMIAIVGKIASGKTRILNYLKEKP